MEKIKDNIALLNNIDFCVVNGGYSALSELFWAEVPDDCYSGPQSF